MNPINLDSNIPEVKEAEEMFYTWIKQGDASNNLEFNHIVNMLQVQAGFHDLDYLDEIAHDFLPQDLERAEYENENGKYNKLIKKIKESIKTIEKMLEEQTNS